jgi:type IV secretion system T-DNA border endonuclease VirD1
MTDNSGVLDAFATVSRAQRLPKKIDPAGYKVVSVRLREGEFATLARQAAKCGMSNNMALRVAARRIAGFIEIDAATREALQAISTRIGEISSSIRRISHLAPGRPGFDMEQFMKDRAAFGREFIELDDHLRSLLSLSKRRIDGCALLLDEAAD